jgi:hypothetical protein
MRHLLAFSLVSLLSAGCSISAVKDQSLQPTKNQCKTSDDCGSGGVCTGGMCRAAQGKFSTVMFEITPPATSVGGFAGIRFLKTLQRLHTDGGQLDLSLDNVTDLRGTFVPTKADFQSLLGCTFDTGKASDGSVPGKVTFTSSAGSLGWSSGTAMVETSFGPTTGPNGESFSGNRFSVTLPPGEYDIYVEPTLPANPDKPLCNVPPQLFRHQHVEGGKVTLPLVLPAPSQFSMTLSQPNGAMSFDGWSARMVDSITDAVLSNPVKLSSDDPTADPVVYQVDFDYSTVVGGDQKGIGHELIELSPPDGVDAPTFYMDRSALQLMSTTKVEVDQFADLPSPVKLKGTVEENDTLVPAKATVTLSATDLDGLQNGTLGSYIKSYETDSQGRFSAKLLPGTYHVQVVPKDPGLAAYETIWTVGATPSVQAGKVLGLDASAKLSGSVLTPAGNDPLVGAPVQAVASPSKSHASVLEAALGNAPLVPRASSDVVDDKGLFTLRTDPGAFDVSVRPPDGTGFPWLVRSNVQVKSGLEDLGQMKMPLPVVYSGLVSVLPSDAGSAVPGALVRAYIFMDAQQSYTSDPAGATSVLPIAETRADGQGNYTLLLPARLN